MAHGTDSNHIVTKHSRWLCMLCHTTADLVFKGGAWESKSACVHDELWLIPETNMLMGKDERLRYSPMNCVRD